MTVNELLEALTEVRDVHQAGDLPVALATFCEPSHEPALSGFALEHIELRVVAGYRQCILSDATSLRKFDAQWQAARN